MVAGSSCLGVSSVPRHLHQEAIPYGLLVGIPNTQPHAYTPIVYVMENAPATDYWPSTGDSFLVGSDWDLNMPEFITTGQVQ